AARAKAGIQIVLAIGAIVACFVAPVIGGIWGRRPVYFALSLLSLVSCAYLFRAMDPFDTGFGLMACFVGGVTAAFYGWLPLYLPELFPTRVRATGQGLSFNFGRILAAAGAVQMGALVRLLGGDYASAGATITLIYVLGLVFIWLAPETKGKPLPE
ncbi:MAG: MFS transporter, partial [Thermoguttaceae bacterium]|nr:MFS transporter [Thermoguttaceae bacterium]